MTVRHGGLRRSTGRAHAESVPRRGPVRLSPRRDSTVGSRSRPPIVRAHGAERGGFMHQDKKISIALGILLVGTVGALFFRHESGASEDDLPQLADPEAVDAKIAEKTLRPYRTPPAKPAPTRSDQYGFSYKGFSQESATATDPEPELKPIPVSDPGSQPSPDHKAAWSVVPGTENIRLSSRERTTRPPTATGPTRTYRVKSGDTLTGLAAKFLGNSQRYHEILRANRDRLKSPRQMRAGMTLLIPARAPAAVPRTPGTSPKTRGPAKQPARTQPAVDKRRFRPVRRSPFILRPRPSSSPSGSRPRSYVIQRGDSLERIARRFYGTRRAVPAIIRANGPLLARPEMLRPGMRIVLP